MTANELFKEAREFCESNADAALVEKYSRYFKEGVYDAWGVGQALFEAKWKELIKEKQVDIPLVIEAAPLLFESGKYEETSFVLIIIKELPKQYNREVFDAIGKMFEYGIYNWAHADTLGMFIMPKFLKQGIVEIGDFLPWLVSPYKFQRRTVPVTLIKSLKTTDDFRVLFNMLEPLMSDPEREVHQGMGWFLREAWKLNHEVTEEFLLKWKNTAPRLIFQYACEKMTEDDKLRFRKEKN
jgi:hypothetical protein